MKKIILSTVFCLLGLPLLAQTYTTTSKKAIKHYEASAEFFKVRKFEEGMEQLFKAIDADENFAEAHYRIAQTYTIYAEKAEAVKYYRNVVKVAPNNALFKTSYFYLATDEMEKGDYKQAKEYAQTFLNLKPSRQQEIDKTKKMMIDCAYSEKNMGNPIAFTSKPMPTPINQFYLQYFPALTGDQNLLVFTARLQPTQGSADSEENIYISRKENNVWTQPVPISPKINTDNNEGTASISADGKVLVFTSCEPRLRENYGQCDLYISYKTGDDWSEPKNLGNQVNSTAWESQPSLSGDGKTLYFISSRPGGKGGRDIWVSTLDDKGKWTAAQNLSETNTAFEEVSPFIHPNGKTLFYGSNGLPGYGGYDIYQTELINKKWSEPQNLGYPFNTHKDQLALFITTDGKKGYYSLEETGDKGYAKSSIIHEFDVPPSMQPKIRSNYVKGVVYDAKTKAKLDAKIDLFDLTENLKQASVTSDVKDGSYLIVLNEGSEYGLEVHKKGYAFKSLAFNYSEEKNIEPVVIDIALEPIAKGTVFRLNNIFFDYNKYDLKDKSKTELDELVKFMQENPKVKGEISGHTDNIGNPQDNLTLSLNRAKSVHSYLVQGGVEAGRLTFKGYGASHPADNNATEEGRANNRRIEFQIMEME
jgi:OmpA-OmpF porin, OOP family